ncbi:MAG: thioredoxin family protein [Salinivirgaceae bacterium]|jgi:thioredoxin-related protein/ribosome-binding factor A|nr:redoxin domain-containing protein [Bacteroidales bacterium]
MIQIKSFAKLLVALVLVFTTVSCQSQGIQDRTVTVYLRGVSMARVSFSPLTGSNAYKPIKVFEQVQNGQNVTFTIKKELIPSDFQLRFDYFDVNSGKPSASEQRIFVNKQNVNLNINPIYATIADSVIFSDNDKENKIYQQFSIQNQSIKENIGLIQMVLSKYDDKNSSFYKEGLKEYKQRIKQHADWLKQQAKEHKDLFVSHTFVLQEVPEIDFSLDEKARKNAMLENYINIIDFKDTLLTHSFDYRKWLDNFVSMHFDRSYTAVQTDSALVSAGRKLIERAKTGDPVVCGKMLDYFFEGYESMGMESGIQMLAEHLNNPKCPATKKEAIIKRIEGISNLKIGTTAPDFDITDTENSSINFHNFGKSKPYKLLMIWSADCEHCQEVTQQLYMFYTNSHVSSKFDVLAVSIDETETEIPKWESNIKDLPKWTHALSKGGLLSQVAKMYYVVSTPVLVIVDTESNKIVGLPKTARDVAMFFSEN